MEKLKILFVIDHLGGGGAEKQFLNLINNIDRNKFEPHLFITEKEGRRFGEVNRDVKIHGLFGGTKRRTLRAFKSIRETITAVRPSVIQTWLEYSTFLTAIALKTLRFRPLLVASHRTSSEELYDYEVQFGRLKRGLLIWAYKQTVTVTTNSRFLRQQLENYGVRRIEIIYNGIDLEPLRKLPSREDLIRKLKLNPAAFYIIFVGALVERKGVEYLVEAVKALERDDIHILIAGDGELREKILSLIDNDRRFTLLGYLSNPGEYIKACDVLVLPSVYEGMPNVVLEAMAAGTPVITTNIYGNPELIEDMVNGLLVQPRDPQQLAEAIGRLAEHPELISKFREVSKNRIDYFNMQRMVSEYEGLYARLLQDVKSQP